MLILLVFSASGLAATPTDDLALVLKADTFRENYYADMVLYYPPDSEAGFLKVSYYPKRAGGSYSGYGLTMFYGHRDAKFEKNLLKQSLAQNRLLFEGPRQGFAVYLGDEKSFRVETAFYVTDVSVNLPAAVRRIRVDRYSLRDRKRATIDIDPTIAIDSNEDTRTKRTAWLKPGAPLLDRAEIIGDSVVSTAIASCLTSDALGKLVKMEIYWVTPHTKNDKHPVRLVLASFQMEQPVYNMRTRLTMPLPRDLPTSLKPVAIEVKCTTVEGKELTGKLAREPRCSSD